MKSDITFIFFLIYMRFTASAVSRYMRMYPGLLNAQAWQGSPRTGVLGEYILQSTPPYQAYAHKDIICIWL